MSNLLSVPTIVTTGANFEAASRKRVMEEVLSEWKRQAPKQVRQILKYLHEITRVECRDGWSKGGSLFTKVRIPTPVMRLMRAAFDLKLPDQPPFAQDDSDLKLLMEIAPKLFPRREKRPR